MGLFFFVSLYACCLYTGRGLICLFGILIFDKCSFAIEVVFVVAFFEVSLSLEPVLE